MMEVDQPITENGLSKMSPTEVDNVKSPGVDSTETPQQNGTIHENDFLASKIASSNEAANNGANEAKGFEDEETMERLMYTDMDAEDEDVLPESSEKPADELAQNLSDTLIEDIIQLNKDSLRAETETDVDPDRLQNGEESCDIPESPTDLDSNQTVTQQVDGEDTNGVPSTVEDDSSIGVEEDLMADAGSETKGVADMDEDSESVLLQDEGNHDLGDDLDVDESLLLDDDVEMGDDGSTQNSAIQIEDSVAVEGTTTEITDGSVTIDESGMSILNNAAVDIGDITAEESIESSVDPKSTVSILVAESIATTEEPTETVEESIETSEPQVKAPLSPVIIKEADAPLSPDISDLITFHHDSEKKDTAVDPIQKDGMPEVSDLIKFSDESCEAQEAASVSPVPELSDLIKFDSVVAEAMADDQVDVTGDKALTTTTISSSADTKQVEKAIVDSSVPVESDLLAEVSDSTESSAPTESSTKTESSTSAESSNPAESSTPAESSAPAESSTPAEYSAPTESIASSESSAPAESSTPAKSNVQAESSAPAESNSPVESVISTESNVLNDSNVPAISCAPEKETSKLSQNTEAIEIPKDDNKNEMEKEENKPTIEKAKDEHAKEMNDTEMDDDTKKETDAEKKEEADDDDEVKQKKDACPQALQAADEEDLLEMMEEPERMEADPEEDLDDNSSESGSTKQVEDGEDEDDFEGSDYMGADDDESSRNVDDQDENIEEEVQVEEQELEEGEPPVKRKCSVDLRDGHDEPNEKPEKIMDSGKKTEEKAEETDEDKTKKNSAENQEKDEEVKLPKSKEDEVIEPDDKNDKENIVAEKKPIESEKKKSTDTTVSESVESKKEDDEVSEKKEEEKMDVSVEETTVPEKAREDEVADVGKSSRSDKTENKEANEKVAQVSQKSEAVVVEKNDTEKVSEDAKTKEVQKEVDASELKAPAKAAEKIADIDKKPAEKANDEVLVIDDDDDEVPETKKEGVDKTEKKAEKRPCPEDENDEKTNADAVKKIRLSTEEKEKKEEDKAEEQKHEPTSKIEEKKSTLDSIEPLNITLEPEPVEPKEKKSIRLEFLEKFKKPLEKMNRSNLEDFVLQKIVEGIAFKSAIAEMRTQLDAQDTLLQGYRQKVHDLNKQFRDLEMVHERVVKDLEKKNQHFITPVKITRAVGLQVSQPRYMAGNRPVNSTTSAVNSPKITVNRSPVATPPGGSPNKNAAQNNILVRRPRINSNTSSTTTQKTPAQQPVRPGLPTILNKSFSSPQNSLLNKSPTVQGQTINTNNNTQPAQTTMSPAQSVPTNANNNATPPLTRKKPLQKFTPMRPPLSITQQVQQQQQTRQMQEQLLRQQIQEVQTSNNSGGQSPLAQSPQGSPLTRTPEPASSPVGQPPNRTQMVVKKVITPQAKPNPPSGMQGLNRPTPSMVTSVPANNARNTPPAPQASAAIDNSLIDLTDEDDVPKPTPVVASQPANQVVPKPPITILNGQQQQQQSQYTQRQAGMPPLVVINQQRMMTRPTMQQRPMANGAPPRPMLMQRPGGATNGFPRQPTYRARMINGQIGAPRGMIARAPIRQPAAVAFTHPAPLPQPGTQLLNPAWKQTPPRPSIRINNIETGIVISWTMDELSDAHATIVSYQIYAYQETNAPPSMDMWRHVGDVKAMLLPMAVTLTQFQEGQRYHFAVRAVDEHQRVGQFSPPRTWNESTPAKA